MTICGKYMAQKHNMLVNTKNSPKQLGSIFKMQRPPLDAVQFLKKLSIFHYYKWITFTG